MFTLQTCAPVFSTLILEHISRYSRRYITRAARGAGHGIKATRRSPMRVRAHAAGRARAIQAGRAAGPAAPAYGLRCPTAVRALAAHNGPTSASPISGSSLAGPEAFPNAPHANRAAAAPSSARVPLVPGAAASSDSIFIMMPSGLKTNCYRRPTCCPARTRPASTGTGGTRSTRATRAPAAGRLREVSGACRL